MVIDAYTMKRNRFGIMACAVACIFTSVSSSNLAVKIDNSIIIGKSVTVSGFRVHQFLGIRYAKSPTGNLRFRKPVPNEQYPPVFKAFDQPPACVQYSDLPFPWYENTTHMSEDCLFLNIWTPAGAELEKPKAVMFWIHGGSFSYGAIRSSLYNGAALSAYGDIVVVTASYRLGVLGFSAFTAGNAIKNAGLWDVLEALKWVNKNIADFGGDTSHITIAGESAGSDIVGLLSIAPSARGLFARQIMQSASPTSMNNARNRLMHNITRELVTKEGCESLTTEESVDCLRKKNAFQLVKDFESIQYTKTTFSPVYGDSFLPGDVRSAVQTGNFYCKELLIGNTQDEGTAVLTMLAYPVTGILGKRLELNETLIKNLSFYLPDRLKFLGQRLGKIIQEIYNRLLQTINAELGDKYLVCPVVHFAEGCAKNRGEVYFYWWAHRSSKTPFAKWMGVAHFTELQFIFGQPVMKPNEYEENEVELSKFAMGVWSNFTKRGTPGIEWPHFSKQNNIFRNLTINPDPVFGKGPHEQSCEALKQQEPIE